MHNQWLLPKVLTAYLTPNFFYFDIDNLISTRIFYFLKNYQVFMEKKSITNQHWSIYLHADVFCYWHYTFDRRRTCGLWWATFPTLLVHKYCCCFVLKSRGCVVCLSVSHDINIICEVAKILDLELCHPEGECLI
jgi:hypothetical protein